MRWDREAHIWHLLNAAGRVRPYPDLSLDYSTSAFRGALSALGDMWIGAGSMAHVPMRLTAAGLSGYCYNTIGNGMPGRTAYTALDDIWTRSQPGRAPAVRRLS